MKDPQHVDFLNELRSLLDNGDRGGVERLFIRYLGNVGPVSQSVVTGGIVQNLVQIGTAKEVHFRTGLGGPTRFPSVIDDRVNQAIQLHATTIFKELDSRASTQTTAETYRNRIVAAIEKFSARAKQLEHCFLHFTPHSYVHSTLTVDVIGQILTTDQIRSLSDLELFLTLAASLLHDFAVIIPHNICSALAKDKAFLSDQAAILDSNRLEVDSKLLSHGINRLIVCGHLRRTQNRPIPLAMDDKCSVYRALVENDRELADALTKIVLAQTLPYPTAPQLVEIPTSERIGMERANLYFIAVIHRIAALLDVRTPRITPAMSALYDPQQALSQLHWEQFATVKVSDLAPGQAIEINGICQTQEAHRHILDWVQYLRDECENAVLSLNTGKEKYTLQLGRVRDEISPAVDEMGIARYEFHSFRFNLDEEQVFQRLFGKRLYGRIDAALRELIQNAIDATRVRLALECISRDGWNDWSAEEQQVEFRKLSFAKAQELGIHVKHEIVVDPETGVSQEWLRVVDRGVGMSRDVIQRFLLKVGRSRWREDPAVRELGLRTIGEFGIGFLSCFMISGRTVIETKSCLPNETGLRATVYNWKGYLATESLTRTSPGTTVSILLTPDVAATIESIAKSVAYWCPFPEFPINISDADGSTQIIDIVRNREMNERLGRYCFEIGDQGSQVALNLEQRRQTNAIEPPLCQDGLVIPDVPPPILENPDQEILRRLGVRVNLRGDDRLPLDLSRNLVDGGADDLWETLVPKIWNGLVNKAMNFKPYREALSDYVQRVFEQSFGRAMILNSKEQGLEVMDANQFRAEASLEFVDPHDDRLFQFARKCDRILLLPHPPFSLTYGRRDCDEDAFRLEHDRVAQFWARKGGSIDFDIGFDFEDISSEVASLKVLTEYAKTLFEKFQFVAKGITNAGKMLGVHAPGVKKLTSLGFWQMSRDWYAVRCPLNGEWCLVHLDDTYLIMDMLPKQLLEKLSFEQYVLLLLYDIWPNPRNWDKGWPNNRNLGKLVSKAQEDAQVERESINRHVDEEDEEDEEEEFEEDPLDAFLHPTHTPPAPPYVRDAPKIGRNDPCPCGSGKKFKKCCG